MRPFSPEQSRAWCSELSPCLRSPRSATRAPSFHVCRWMSFSRVVPILPAARNAHGARLLKTFSLLLRCRWPVVCGFYELRLLGGHNWPPGSANPTTLDLREPWMVWVGDLVLVDLLAWMNYSFRPASVLSLLLSSSVVLHPPPPC